MDAHYLQTQIDRLNLEKKENQKVTVVKTINDRGIHLKIAKVVSKNYLDTNIGEKNE
jgi:hypothetical protein